MGHAVNFWEKERLPPCKSSARVAKRLTKRQRPRAIYHERLERPWNRKMIYQGNCLKVLPQLSAASFDAVVADPPYCSGAAGLAGKQRSPSYKYQQTGAAKVYPDFVGDAKDQRSFIRWSAEWLSECWRVAKGGAPLLVFTDWRQLPALTDAVQMADWSWQGLVIWHKPSARPMRGAFRRDAEFVIYATKGKREHFNDVCLPGVYKHHIDARRKHHVTGKPVELIRDLLEIVPPGGVVLDPFLGSGTTAVACAETGRTCVGIEISEEYSKIAKERVKRAVCS